MTQGPGNAASADSQAVAATSIDDGIDPVRSLVRGKSVSIATFPAAPEAGGSAPVEYLRGYLREILAEEGATDAGERGGELRIEIHAVSAGQAAVRRNLVAPLQQNIRIPLFYSEGMKGGSLIVLLVRTEGGETVPYRRTSTDAKQTDIFLFKILGPYRR